MKRPALSAGRSLRVFAYEHLESRTLLAADLPPVIDQNVTPTNVYADPTALFAVGSSVFYRGTKASTGAELWVTDGTEVGTRLVKDTWAGTTSAIHATSPI